MKRFKIEQSTADIVGQSGLALIRQAINRYTTLTQELDTQVPLRHGIKHSDVAKSYLGLVSAGKNDFEAINTIESELFFTPSMGITDILSEATLRQRMDNHAKAFLPVVEKASRDFLKNINLPDGGAEPQAQTMCRLLGLTGLPQVDMFYSHELRGNY